MAGQGRTVKCAGLADLGVVGLGVMGRNLALNLAGRGFAVAGCDSDADKCAALEDALMADGGKGEAHSSLSGMVAALARPRRILLLVPAGAAVDEVIAALLPMLDAGDVLVDGGNSHYPDTERRAAQIAGSGVHFLGVGISGGAEGARLGASIMAGGDEAGLDAAAGIFEAAAAMVGDEPCFVRLRPAAAGHFVKTVHNGIEYALMQLIAEAYDLLTHLAGLAPDAIASVFGRWRRGKLESYLIGITADILDRVDPETGLPMVDIIEDRAGQKGTGGWAAAAAFEFGVAAPTLAEAVYARSVSAMKEARAAAARAVTGPDEAFTGERGGFIAALAEALFAASLAAYVQGFAVIAAAGERDGWSLDAGAIANAWRGGCIIRATMLAPLAEGCRKTGAGQLLLDPWVASSLQGAQAGWREVVVAAVRHGIPVPGLASALSWFDSSRRARLPANLVQAQRDYFGAHGYQRTDRPGVFHTDWKRG